MWLKYSFPLVAQILVPTWLKYSLTFTQDVIFSKMTLLANISCKKIRYSPTHVWLEKDGRTLLFGKRKSH